MNARGRINSHKVSTTTRHHSHASELGAAGRGRGRGVAATNHRRQLGARDVSRGCGRGRGGGDGGHPRQRDADFAAHELVPGIGRGGGAFGGRRVHAQRAPGGGTGRRTNFGEHLFRRSPTTTRVASGGEPRSPSPRRRVASREGGDDARHCAWLLYVFEVVLSVFYT